MAIEAPDYEAIARESGQATSDAIRTLFLMLVQLRIKLGIQ